MVGGADLHAALQHGSVLDADALGDDIPGQRTLAADVQAISALNVAVHLAHNHNFAGANVGRDAAVTSNGYAIVGKTNGALDPAVDVKRFRAADFALDDQRTADRGLLHGSTCRLGRGEIGIRGELR